MAVYTLYAATAFLLGAQPGRHSLSSAAPPHPVTPASVRLLVPENVRRGEVLRVLVAAAPTFPLASITAKLIAGKEAEKITYGWRIAGADRGGELWQFLFGIASTASPGDVTLHLALRGADGRVVTRQESVRVEPRAFRAEDIALSYALAQLQAGERERRMRESRELWTLLETTDLSARHHAGRFVYPLRQFRRTSFFGDRRRYRYVDGTSLPSIHNGLDMAAAPETPVIAPARGRVAMARGRIISGNTVVLEHQPGVYSLYYHLERVTVTRGQLLERGEPLGVVGSTGLSTGPHLHWEVRVSGVAVDPEWFLRFALVDRSAIATALLQQP